MSYTVAQVAERVDGIVRGDGSVVITHVAPLHQAGSGAITFAADRKNEAALATSLATAAFVTPQCQLDVTLPLILVMDPFKAAMRLALELQPSVPLPSPGLDSRAAIAPTAIVGPGCSVGAFAVIEDHVELGAGCIVHPHAVIRSGAKIGVEAEIHPHAVIYPRCEIGPRSIVHAGAVIGADGFGYQFAAGRHQKVPQLGNVVVGADVEVGACTTIDRATLGSTTIGDGTKIDNQVQIGHNSRIGRHNIFVAQVGFAGSSSTGDYVVLAGKVGIADHVHVGERAVVGASSGAFTDIPPGERYLGQPARPERDYKRLLLELERVGEMRRQLAEVRTKLGLRQCTGSATDESTHEEHKAAG